MTDDDTPAVAPIAAKRFTVMVEPDFEPMIPRFLQNRSRELSDMQAASGRGDFERIGRLAHGMKGASGNYGFEGLAAWAAIVEQAAAKRDRQRVSEGLAGVARYLAGVDVVYQR